MSTRTTVWSLTNPSQQTIACTLEQLESGIVRLTIEMDGNELVTSTHYTAEEATRHASELRTAFTAGGWLKE